MTSIFSHPTLKSTFTPRSLSVVVLALLAQQSSQVSSSGMSSENSTYRQVTKHLPDFVLMATVEKHPENVMAALVGGFIELYLRELDEKDTTTAS
ncbi:Trihydroxynaphthalene reductase, partial [Marasmius crinis-equi]